MCWQLLQWWKAFQQAVAWHLVMHLQEKQAVHVALTDLLPYLALEKRPQRPIALCDTMQGWWSFYCRGPLNLAPWLYVIPGDLASFKELFLQLGVHDGFAAPQYLGMLSDLAEVSHGESLAPAELEQAISVVQVGAALRLGCHFTKPLLTQCLRCYISKFHQQQLWP